MTVERLEIHIIFGFLNKAMLYRTGTRNCPRPPHKKAYFPSPAPVGLSEVLFKGMLKINNEGKDGVKRIKHVTIYDILARGSEVSGHRNNQVVLHVY